MENSGILYVISTPIGNLADMTSRAINILNNVDIIACEDTRSSRSLLNHLDIKTKCISYHEHSDYKETELILETLRSGASIALISDAGTPLICDPGFKLVRTVRNLGINVIPVPGACAVTAALSVSGLSTDSFLFKGFLPRKKLDRIKTLKDFCDYPFTLIFYESPHRVLKSLKDIELTFGSKRRIFMAREMTKLFETYILGSVEDLIDIVERDTNNQKGEIVLVVEGCEKKSKMLGDASTKILTLLLEEISSSKASAIAAKITGENKKMLYQEAIRIKRDK